MIPRSFHYHRPRSVEEAVQLLIQFEGAKILAGGQSLIPLMKLRLASPEHIVDINGLSELSYIKQENGIVRIGALTRSAEIEHSPLIKRYLPLLSEAAEVIADRQVRNLGTMVGSLCHADPSGDWAPCVLALNSELVARGKEERTIKATEFFRGPFETALEHDEILVEVRIKIPTGDKVGQAYLKFERKAGDFAVVGVACTVSMNEDKQITDAGLALCSVNDVPFRAKNAEKVLIGNNPTKETIEQASDAAVAMCNPWDDSRGPREYKLPVAKALTRRAIQTAIKRAVSHEGVNLS